MQLVNSWIMFSSTFKDNGGIDLRSHTHTKERMINAVTAQEHKGAYDVGFVDVELATNMPLKHAIATRTSSIAIDVSHESTSSSTVMASSMRRSAVQ